MAQNSIARLAVHITTDTSKLTQGFQQSAAATSQWTKQLTAASGVANKTMKD